jgi:hypothetical protein
MSMKISYWLYNILYYILYYIIIYIIYNIIPFSQPIVLNLFILATHHWDCFNSWFSDVSVHWVPNGPIRPGIRLAKYREFGTNDSLLRAAMVLKVVIYIYTYILIYICEYMCVYIYTYIYIHIYIYAYRHIYIIIYIHTNIVYTFIYVYITKYHPDMTRCIKFHELPGFCDF